MKKDVRLAGLAGGNIHPVVNGKDVVNVNANYLQEESVDFL